MRSSDSHYTVCTIDGELIADRVSKEQILRLKGCNPDGYLIPGRVSLVVKHKRKDSVYFALVPQAVIVADLQRDIQPNMPVTQANYTFTRVEYVAKNGNAGWYYQHNNGTCFYFKTYDRSANEMARIALRQMTHLVSKGSLKLAFFQAWFHWFRMSAKEADKHTREDIARVHSLLEAYKIDRLTTEGLLHDLSGKQKTAAA